ncbi:MAG: Hsp70 family protein [Verrucomicrobiota bacterium]
MARCAIGIDLGTSNCALEWCELGKLDSGGTSELEVSTFKIRQYESAERVIEQSVLPSFVYFHPEADSKTPYHVGLYAWESLKDTPARCIHSAKSWLCHSGIDRESSILPWQSSQVGSSQKLSPVEASAAYLSYLRRSWDNAFKNRGPEYAFSEQQITVTVPASFDQVAQRLTLQAAKRAGFPESTRLLEEPQAAFLAWIQDPENRAILASLQEKDAIESLKVLVCDVGGGTTDFSLFRVNTQTQEHDPEVERIAVSDHILLGGDNIDLALAKRAELEFAAQGYHVQAEQWLQLVAQARMAKEGALSESSVGETVRIVLTNTGSSLFAGTRSLEWNRLEVIDWICEQFFPKCAANAVAQREAGGFVELGLPYAQDPAVTVHLAEFLKGEPIEAILFNGGTVSSRFIQKRITEVVGAWQSSGTIPLLISGDDPYLAVARGAALYGQRLKAHADTLIRAGAARPFLIEIQANERAGERHLLCVLPKGATPADSFTIKKPSFALRLDRPVQFQSFKGPDSDRMRQGQIVKWKPEQFSPMPPLQTLALSGETVRLSQSEVSREVYLHAQLNELGLVEVSCLSSKPQKKGASRWDLSFDIRQVLASENQLVESQELAVGFQEKVEIFKSRFSQAFSERILKELEQESALKRTEWPLSLLRAGFDTLIDNLARRDQSEAQETAWWMALGYCMRPGFGAPLDDFRIQQLDALYVLELGYPSSKSVREQYAVFWRRVAGGLNAEMQERLFHSFQDLAFSGTKRGLEPLKTLAALERLKLADKRTLIGFLRKAIEGAPRWAIESYLWCLGRVCARVPLSASQDAVVPPAELVELMERILPIIGNDVPKNQIRNMIMLSARVSGVRESDLPEAARTNIIELAEARGIGAEELKALRELVPVVKAERQSQYGEALPQGLVLV